MSTWTHAHGVIRYNRIQSLDYGMAMNDPRITRPYPGYKLLQELIDLPRPEGSEGPLQAILWNNPQVSHLASGMITIFGDLRDFHKEDCKAIEEYFEELTIKQATRDAVLAYYTEFDGDTTILTWDHGEFNKKKKEFKEIIRKTKLERTL